MKHGHQPRSSGVPVQVMRLPAGRAPGAAHGPAAPCLTIPLSCPHCGGQLAVMNEGGTNGFEAKIVMHCATKPDVGYLVTTRIDALAALVRYAP